MAVVCPDEGLMHSSLHYLINAEETLITTRVNKALGIGSDLPFCVCVCVFTVHTSEYLFRSE